MRTCVLVPNRDELVILCLNWHANWYANTKDKVLEAGECMCRARMQQQMYGEVECERDKRVAEDVSMM